ncbi:MAG TPA: tripartite tricarboxylate transporter substrate binding protein [Burkholderiales bacterium]|nr:tripartite tricarboxylate transporter substrate binding protein [Burkholderiales bacterium]
MFKTRALLCASVALALQAFAATAPAQTYPAKPVRLIVPFPPGGSNDIVGRLMAAELTEKLGKQVVVDNRGGAGGVLGTELAASADPDGHTLLIISVAYAFNPAMYKLRFNPETAFVPISILGSGPNALTVNPKLPVSTAKDLIALAKAQPGKLNYASSGVGSFQHLGSELFRIMAGINVVHVPFKGGGPAMADVIAGNTEICLGSLIQMIPHVDNKRLKLLGIGGKNRAKVYPNVPTIAESGLPGYDASNWWGLLAPAKTPKPVVDRLRAETAKILAQPELQKKFEGQGAETVKMSPDEFGRFIKTEMVKWGKVVKEAGIKAE